MRGRGSNRVRLAYRRSNFSALAEKYAPHFGHPDGPSHRGLLAGHLGRGRGDALRVLA